MISSRDSRPTVDLCYYKHPTGESCNADVLWKIATERGHTFKCCDEHLAWSLRFSGLPAIVNEFPKKSDQTQKIKMRSEVQGDIKYRL